jgi:hypothetical protein
MYPTIRIQVEAFFEPKLEKKLQELTLHGNF